MRIDRDEARRVAVLARLAMDERELDAMAAEMTRILTYIDQIAAVDASAATGERDAVVATPLREDVIRESVPRSAAQANAPRWEDGFFVVPKVIGE